MERCGSAGCSNNAMPGLIPPCDHCKKKMCIGHQAPESHGCRDAAKNAARMNASKEASEVRQAKKEHDTADLRKKMAEKREELAQARAKKPRGK
jgi:hypothetical protein